MIFIDSNIPMYLVGAEHPNKRTTLVVLEKLTSTNERLVTNAEVLQEIFHRYVAIQRKSAIQDALDALYGFIDLVFPIEERDALETKNVLLGYTKISARDALHVAIMRRYGVKTIFSFDTGFDLIPDIDRLYAQ